MSTASAGSQGRGSLSPSPTHRLTREWPARSPVRLRPSAALPAAEFSPNAHRTLVSRGLQVFGVGVGVSACVGAVGGGAGGLCVCVCVCVCVCWVGKPGTGNASNHGTRNSPPRCQEGCTIPGRQSEASISKGPRVRCAREVPEPGDPPGVCLLRLHHPDIGSPVSSKEPLKSPLRFARPIGKRRFLHWHSL